MTLRSLIWLEDVIVKNMIINEYEIDFSLLYDQLIISPSQWIHFSYASRLGGRMISTVYALSSTSWKYPPVNPIAATFTSSLDCKNTFPHSLLDSLYYI